MILRKYLPVTVFLLVILDIVFFVQAGLAADCSISDPRYTTSPGSAINITTVGFSGGSEVQTAIGYWSGCQGYGDSIPTFQVGGSGGVPITIRKIVGRSNTPGGGCGIVDPEIVNGHLEGAEITVWTQQSTGESCEPISDSIAHELGHVLGLADATDPSCAGRIMGHAF